MHTIALHRTLTVAMLACVALLPAACNQQEAAPAQETADMAPDDPEAPAGTSITKAHLVLPAVAGNPAAVYFDIRNGGNTPLVIAGVHVSGAGMAMLHSTRTEAGTARMEHVEQVPVAIGETVSFVPGGLHVMVHDLQQGASPGTVYEVTLTFANGDKISFPAPSRAMGDRS